MKGKKNTRIERCGETTKVPSRQGRRGGREKLRSGSERCGFSLSAEPISLLSSFCQVWELWVIKFVFKRHMSRGVQNIRLTRQPVRLVRVIKLGGLGWTG